MGSIWVTKGCYFTYYIFEHIIESTLTQLVAYLHLLESISMNGEQLMLRPDVPEQAWALLLKAHCLQQSSMLLTHAQAKSLLFHCNSHYQSNYCLQINLGPTIKLASSNSCFKATFYNHFRCWLVTLLDPRWRRRCIDYSACY